MTEEPKPAALNGLRKTLLINLSIEFIYVIYLVLEPNEGRFSDFGDLLALAINASLQVAICFIASFVYYTTDRKERGRALLVSALFVAGIAVIVGGLMAI